METNIQNLVDKIYQDGVEKARNESEKILNRAREEAKSILESAKLEAENVRQQADKENENQKRAALSELHLGASQVLSDLRRRIENLISDRILKEHISQIALDSDFLKELILSITSAWQSKNGISEVDLLLPETLKKKADQAFQSEIARFLEGLTIEFDSSLHGGFKISRKNDTYRLDFSDEAMIEFFKPFLRKKTSEFLMQGTE